MVMLPAALVTLIPEPAVRVERVKPAPLPMGSWPLVALEASKPVPPLAVGKIPVKVMLPVPERAMLPVAETARVPEASGRV